MRSKAGSTLTWQRSAAISSSGRFPFMATSVIVEAKTGEIGWYDCKVAVLPNIQFEGLNVELMLESRLG